MTPFERLPRPAFGGLVEILLGVTVGGAAALAFLSLWRSDRAPGAPPTPLEPPPAPEGSAGPPESEGGRSRGAS